ncbi:hypothetical protein OG883_34765 [Streptomyces sp. NBC_01142]|uniref:hypothetical protein n=1 Tax=Streptomyces sp. NBC_01142 TaxID=2975865 RepID=UPI00224CAF97|nr:hypothetical protein [Streptomyces sp. NBC_01142]MCX4824931.1 hypothetical protein [Streptomyces sp. NBC_01142]
MSPRSANRPGPAAVTGYEQSLPTIVEWLSAQPHGTERTEAFPEMAAQYAPQGDLFGHAVEDARLEQHGRGAK